MTTVVQSNDVESQERYRRLQNELQQERETSHKQLYLKSNEIESLRINLSSHEQELKRLRREIESLEAKLRAQQPSSHSSSLILTTKQQKQQDVQLIVPKTQTQSRSK